MDLEIGAIRVHVEGDDWDEDEITREVQWRLIQAFEQIAKRDAAPSGPGFMEIDELALPPVDWESETDRTTKLVELILDAMGGESDIPG